MITINATILTELVLFLIFLWVSNKLVVRPILKTIDARNDQIEHDKEFAETQRQEAKRTEAAYVEQVTHAHRDAAQRLHQARYDAYAAGRGTLEALRGKSEAEIAAFSAEIEAEVAKERQKIEELLPALVEEADRKVNTEGSLL